ncbi:MAG: hypothetical protein IKW06_05165 [Clostridia bacterium]|nr:hypothetical protein [Clostridia bacterium]
MSDILILRGEVGRTEFGAVACDVLLLGVLIYNQILHGLNMWFLILPLVLIGFYLVVFGILPERYCFTASSLEIWNFFYKVDCISYETVFNLEAKSRDNFVNLLQENKVKLYYSKGKSHRMVICKPKNVHAFVEELKGRCPGLAEDESESKLESFLNQ